MTDQSLDSIRRGGERLMEEVAREEHLAHAGFKESAELQPIYARHAGVLGPDALAATLEAFRSTDAGSEAHRSARALLEWEAEAGAARVVAPLEERQIAWEATAVVRQPDGTSVPYSGVSIAIANATDRRERLALDEARAALVTEQLAPLRRERLEREKDYVESLDVAPGYVATFEAVSGVNVTALVDECRAFLRETQAMWDETLAAVARRALPGVPVRELTRADALALFRAREYDRFFPAAELEPSVRRQVVEMGVDPTAGGRVTYDLAEREGKRSRAFCSPVRMPDEVYLVLRPHGGQQDYSTLLHELGHALHFAYMRPDLPFEFRWVGDNSVTEGYAMLFDHRMMDRGWLLRYTSLGRNDASAFLRQAAFEELQFLRRYCAKLVYEVQLYGGEVPWASLPDLYVETLTAATTFRYRPADAFVDVDPRFYASRYLRAWQLQAVLAESLVERFDDDWWRNPRAGPFVVGQLFGEGQRELATELAERVAGRPLSFAPLVRAVERALA